MDKCFHCGEPLSKKDKVCPRCGAKVTAPGEPRTIYELRWFCAQHNMPLAQMRFFLGEDYEGPRAFGIYQDDDGDYVVYKNKADGVRSVRYKGPDEAHAVHEIYQKLLSEITQRKGGGRPAPKRGKTAPNRAKKRGAGTKVFLLSALMMLALMIGTVFVALWKDRGPRSGYYAYDDGYYYSQYGNWYYYDDDDWYPWEVDDTLRENYGDYYVGRAYDDSYGAEDFCYSDYYYEPDDSWDDDSDDTWDDDSDYTWDDDWDDDWDDWDDGDTDWDSDW